eukprot:m.306365 g.306365  ORF g.306365 m.306365 type:complete len:96 (-) comp16456_c0_seq2:106-393(-)
MGPCSSSRPPPDGEGCPSNGVPSSGKPCDIFGDPSLRLFVFVSPLEFVSFMKTTALCEDSERTLVPMLPTTRGSTCLHNNRLLPGSRHIAAMFCA